MSAVEGGLPVRLDLGRGVEVDRGREAGVCMPIPEWRCSWL